MLYLLFKFKSFDQFNTPQTASNFRHLLSCGTIAAIFNLVFRKGNIIYLHYESNVGPKCLLTFSRKGHVGLVRNRTGVNFRTRTKFYRANITAIEHTSVWPFTSNGYTFQLVQS